VNQKPETPSITQVSGLTIEKNSLDITASDVESDTKHLNFLLISLPTSGKLQLPISGDSVSELTFYNITNSQVCTMFLSYFILNSGNSLIELCSFLCTTHWN